MIAAAQIELAVRPEDQTSGAVIGPVRQPGDDVDCVRELLRARIVGGLSKRRYVPMEMAALATVVPQMDALLGNTRQKKAR